MGMTLVSAQRAACGLDRRVNPSNSVKGANQAAHLALCCDTRRTENPLIQGFH